MNPVLDLLNRLLLANPTLALEEVKHLLIQMNRDISYWRDKHARADQELSAAQYDNAVLSESYAKLLDQKHTLEAKIKALNSAGVELTRKLKDLGE